MDECQQIITFQYSEDHLHRFRSKNKKVSEVNLMVNGHVINRVQSTKFLGVIINEYLNWNEHVNYIRGKIAKGIGILCKARKVLCQSTLISLYYSFIYPYLNYCVVVWGSTTRHNINLLLKLQKRAVRVITFSHYRAHALPLFLNLNLLQFHYIYQMFLFRFYV